MPAFGPANQEHPRSTNVDVDADHQLTCDVPGLILCWSEKTEPHRFDTKRVDLGVAATLFDFHFMDLAASGYRIVTRAAAALYGQL